MEEARRRVVRAWMREEVVHHKCSDPDPIHETYLLWVSKGVFPASSSRRSLVAEENYGLGVPRAEWEGAEWLVHWDPCSLIQPLGSHPDPPRTGGSNLPGPPTPCDPCLARSQPVHVALLQQTLQNSIKLVPGLGHLQLWGRRYRAGLSSQAQGRWAANWARGQVC